MTLAGLEKLEWEIALAEQERTAQDIASIGRAELVELAELAVLAELVELTELVELVGLGLNIALAAPVKLKRQMKLAE